MVLYADDTTLDLFMRSLGDIENSINLEINNINN